jgi:hypothetical protein
MQLIFHPFSQRFLTTKQSTLNKHKLSFKNKNKKDREPLVTNHYLQFPDLRLGHIQRRRKPDARMQSVAVYICAKFRNRIPQLNPNPIKYSTKNSTKVITKLTQIGELYGPALQLELISGERLQPVL